MKYLILAAVLLFSAYSQAQNKTYEVSIQSSDMKQINETEYATTVYKFAKTDKYSLAFVSAYAEKEDARIQLSYQVTSNGKKSTKLDFTVDNEGITPGRTIFRATTIVENFESIQFFADLKTETIINFRLFMPEVNKKQANLPQYNKNNLEDCACPQPEICDRLCWCDDCPPDATPAYTTPTHIIVHHSAGHNVSNDYAAVVESYWDYHVNTKGWDDIGYNWLIDPNGVIYEGRGDGVRGAHFSCMNTGTTGICLVGNFEEAEPSAAALSALTSMIAWESCDKGILPASHTTHTSSELDLYHVSGHRDGNTSPASGSCASGTVCPGESLYLKLEEVRNNAAAFGCMSSIQSIENEGSFSISPNPSKGIFLLDNSDIHVEVQNVMISDISGKIIKTVHLTNINNSISIDLSSFADGVYFIFIKTSEGVYKTKAVKM